MLVVILDIKLVVLSSTSVSRQSSEIWGVVSRMTKQPEESMKNMTKMKNWV